MTKQEYKAEVQEELKNILDYWMKHTVDVANGGFVGRVNNDNEVDVKAPKGSVLNSRLLWTFSAAYNLNKNVQYLQMAERAYKYIRNYFIDKKFGGVYWTVDHRGDALDTKKQVYALSFAIYGLSEYAKAAEDNDAKELAISLYKDILKHSYDSKYGGYIEAYTREWQEIEDLRLSDKDANEKKTMNTHLHVLEGFANLYRVWPDAGLKEKIAELIHNFLDHIIDKETNHLRLFFSEDWTSKGNMVSYGHDIEAAWLVHEAAEIIQDHNLVQALKEKAKTLADAAARGLDKDGGLWYEKEGEHLVKEKHWWPQAEAMVGFYNAYQVSDEEDYLQKSIASWQFIKRHIKDHNKGEWYWGVTEDYSIMEGQDKAGLWKCNYHNGRACIEIINRIK
ncbi:AGE family epimerase/isomerase [Aridibaculum aurantiacum]|uniref:AGE family epimerase/isomerase n=1 Tax=Aridibaculum aurantiacum TaxID=2810307 RepID=UPI001A973F77|nr:AGE family epimerase/isomerase [Aridibaculum aurantiacum]